MQSKATTVDAYLAALPQDRRLALQAVREVFLKNVDENIEEGMQYGMIGYYVPHHIYPPGYHCDPKQPLCYAGLASQKNHMSLYMMGCYGESALLDWFVKAWKKTGKKLDMGKACIRFKRLEDLPLEVIAETLRRMPTKKFIAVYEAAKETMYKRSPKKKPASASKSAPTKPPAKRSTAKAKSKAKPAKGRG
jgi:hypothetical protein